MCTHAFSQIFVVQIDRIQSPTFYIMYSFMKKMLQENNPDQEIERNLWHGTAVRETSVGMEPLVSICVKGFNRNYSGSSTGKN